MKSCRMAAIVWILFQTAVLSAQQTNETSAGDYFKILRQKNLAMLPDRFTAVLTGKTIAKKMASIPPDSLLDKSKSAFVELNYTRKSGISVLVKNTDDLYRDLYRDLPKQFFAFDLILSAQENDSYMDRYSISYRSVSSNLIVMKLSVKSAENNLLLYILPDQFLINRVDYLVASNLMTSTIISYSGMEQDGKIYRLPNRFITKNLSGKTEQPPEVFEINRYQLSR